MQKSYPFVHVEIFFGNRNFEKKGNCGHRLAT